MKKLMSRVSDWVFVIVCLGCIVFAGLQAGCHIGPDKPEKDDHGRVVYNIGQDMYEGPDPTSIMFEYIMVDGHEYLAARGYRKYGLTHSPKCPCHKELKHE